MRPAELEQNPLPGLLFGVLLAATAASGAEPGQFVDATAAAGVAFDHQTTQTILTEADFFAAPPGTMDEVPLMDSSAEIMSTWLTGGVAVGDYDGDSLPDIFAVGGDAGTARLFRNLGDGTFVDKASAAGVAVSGERQAGAMFADVDGDFDLDLFVGGGVGTPPRLFRNDGPNGQGETTFTDIFATAFAGYDLARSPNNWGGSFGDYDLDGDLDVFFAASMTPFGPALEDIEGSSQHLWRNDSDPSEGTLTFTDVSVDAGISVLFTVIPAGQTIRQDHTFSPNFTDVDEDGYPDLLVVSDRGDSLILINEGDGTFRDETVRELFLIGSSGAVAGMGAAVGDFDTDGHLDWFVSQIRSPIDGNRLYQGHGDGTFTDLVHDPGPFPSLGMESGYWGWGACFADLDNDRHLDIFHVNGFYWSGNPFSPDGLFSDMPAVAFIADGDGTFTERGTEIGLDDVAEGRGVSCFDFDRDGDVDIAISNHRGPFKLYRNTLNSPEGAGAGFAAVRLRGRAPNTEGIGARLELLSTHPADEGPAPLVREMRVDGNFVSSNLAEAHFGLGDWLGPFEVEVTWPGGQTTLHSSVARDSLLTIEQLTVTLPTALTFEEDAPATLTGGATGPAGEDRGADLEWSEGTLDNVLGSGPTFDASGRPAGEHGFFLAARGAAGALTWLPFTLLIEPATPPLRSAAGPSGDLLPGMLEATLTLATDEDATCRYDTVPGTAFESMPNTFQVTGGTAHQSLVTGLEPGLTYSFYVRCSDPHGHANPDDLIITFTVLDPLFWDGFESGDTSAWM